MRAFFVFLALAVGTLGWADAIYLKDGRIISGAYLGGTASQVRIDLGDKVASYNVADITRIEFAASAQPQYAPQPPRAQAPPQQVDERPRLMRADPAPASEAPPQASLVIPQGTLLKVRMIDSVDSETSQIGQTFQAALDDPVVVDGQTTVPRGADVVAKLVEDKESGKISGRTELTLDLVSIRVNGKMLNIVTGGSTTSSGSRGAKSGKVIGGAAAAGAVLGGIFGGGKGAAIGAASGAGAGGAVQVLTKGQRVKIPAETRLSFTLQNDLRI